MKSRGHHRSDSLKPLRFYVSPEEKEILQYMADGWSYLEIAKHTFIPKRRIDQYLYNLRERCNIQSILRLTYHALKAGWIK